MTRKFSGKKSLIASIILVVILLISIRFAAATDRTDLTQIEIILRDLMAPLYSGVTQISNTIVNIGNSITSYNDLLEENRTLREQVRQLSMQVGMMEEYRLENQRLTDLWDIQEIKGDYLNLVAARVIGRDFGNWFETIRIDKGTNHGIEVDMAVINHQGLVGRVVLTSRTTSDIKLLLDRESAVGSRVLRSRAFGVVEATTFGDYPLQMINIPLDALSEEVAVEVGDEIRTAGLGDIFPRGLKIGYVAKVDMAPTGLSQQVMIIPAVDFNRLEEVMVITEVIMELLDDDLPDDDLPDDDLPNGDLSDDDLPDNEELGEGEDE